MFFFVFFLLLLCSFVVVLPHFTGFCRLSLPPLPFRENMKHFWVLMEALFIVFSLYPALPPISPLTFACQSLSCSCDNAFFLFVFLRHPLWSLSFLFCPSLPLSSPVLFFSSSSFRRVTGALYFTSCSHLNWLAVNFRPPIAKWLVPLSCSFRLSVIYS